MLGVLLPLAPAGRNQCSSANHAACVCQALICDSTQSNPSMLRDGMLSSGGEGRQGRKRTGRAPLSKTLEAGRRRAQLIGEPLAVIEFAVRGWIAEVVPAVRGLARHGCKPFVSFLSCGTPCV